MGILIKRYQTGGTIYTSNYNSPQLRSYNDSLGSYNESRLLINKLQERTDEYNKFLANHYKIQNEQQRQRGQGIYLTDKEEKERAIREEKRWRIWNHTLVREPLEEGKEQTYLDKRKEMSKKYSDKGIEPSGSGKIWQHSYEDNHEIPGDLRELVPEDEAWVRMRPDVYDKPKQVVKYADPEIVAKQQKLKDAGLYDGPLDGIFGKNSQAALKKLEERNKLKEEAPKEESKKETHTMPDGTVMPGATHGDVKEEKKDPYIIKIVGGFGPTNLKYVDSAGTRSSIASNALTLDKYKNLKVEEVPYGNKKPKGLLIKK